MPVIIVEVPFVFPNKNNIVGDVFNRLGLGQVKKLEKTLLEGRTGKYYRVRVHIDWDMNPENADAVNALTEFAAGKTVQIAYEGEWYWKVRQYIPPGDEELLAKKNVNQIVREQRQQRNQLAQGNFEKGDWIIVSPKTGVK